VTAGTSTVAIQPLSPLSGWTEIAMPTAVRNTNSPTSTARSDGTLTRAKLSLTPVRLVIPRGELKVHPQDDADPVSAQLRYVHA
jgi:hypothetical protein